MYESNYNLAIYKAGKIICFVIFSCKFPLLVAIKSIA